MTVPGLAVSKIASYQTVPTGTPVVVQTAVIRPLPSKYGLRIIAIVLTVMAVMSLCGGIMIIAIGVFPFASLPFLIIGSILLFGAVYLFYKGSRSSSDQHAGLVEGGTQAFGVPVAQQVVSYPTTPAAPSVPGCLVSTYTYTPHNQPSPASAPAPTYPYPAGGQAPNYPSPGQVPAPAYPYAGGQAPPYPMDQKPPVGAPVGVPVGASATGFQAPPTAPSPYQPPPPYAPGEEPPPYSS